MYFILGIVFVDLLLPLLEGIAAVWLAKMETTKGKYSLEISKIGAEIQKLEATEEPQHLIGFQVSSEEEYEEEENE